MTKKRFLSFGLVLTLCLAACLFVVTSTAKAISLDELNIPEEMEYGSTYAFPEATMNAGGTQAAATVKLIYPGGRESVAGATRAILDQAGIYKLVFSATSQGKTYTEERAFTVQYPYYETKSKADSVSYGAHKYTPDVNGLIVDMSVGGTLTFNKIVNISNLTSSDEIFSLYTTPEKIGTDEFSSYQVILTDAYDPQNYITYVVVNVDANKNSTSYVKAGSSRQSLTGVEIWGSGERIHTYDYYGTPVSFTLMGKEAPQTASNKLSFSIDYASRCVYANGTRVVDLDSTKYFTDLWNGFTTGEVKISFKPIVGYDARVVITNVYGMDLSEKKIADTVAPTLSIDYNGYSKDDIPEAQASRPYKTFDASAIDAYTGVCTVEKNVYFNYNSGSPLKMTLKDGYFTPHRAGTFTVEYVAVDNFGNKKTEIVEVVSQSSFDPVTVDVSSVNSSGALAGYDILLDSVTASGGSGKLDVSYVISHAKGESAYRVTDSGFKPLESGTYTVTFTAQDYVGNIGTGKVTINVAENPTPIVEKEADLPKNFLEGFEYILPDMTAVSYYSGTTTVASEITVTDSSGSKKLAADRKYTPAVAASGDTVTLNYLAKTSHGQVSRTYTVPCYKVKSGNDIDMGKYFLASDGVTVTPQSELMVFTFANEGEVEYLNGVSQVGFEMVFNLGNKAGKVTFFLEDRSRPGEGIKITLKQLNSKVYLVLNDKEEYETEASFSSNITLSYDALLKKVFVGRAGYEAEDLYLFDSGIANLSWTVAEVTSQVQFKLIRLNGQVFSSDTEDYGKPFIAVYGSYGGRRNIGTVYETLLGFLTDVLDPSVTSYMSVKTPSNTYVTADDGTVLNQVDPKKVYRFTLSEYGNYAIEYYAEDSWGNLNSFKYSVRVWDVNPPTITINGKVPEKASVNAPLELPSASASDSEKPAAITVYASYKSPSGQVRFISDDVDNPSTKKVFTPTEKGEYIITYYCFDTNGNLAELHYTVKVS